MTSHSNEIKQKWQPNIPTHNDADDEFLSGPTETPHYVVPDKTVYTLESLEKETLEQWSALDALGVLATSDQSVELNFLAEKKDFLSRLRHISEPMPVVPMLSIRELVDSLLDAFAALLKTKGYERLSNLIILDFRIEAAIGDLVVQIKDILSSVQKLQNIENIYEVLLGGEGQKPLDYYSTSFIPFELITDTVFTKSWYQNGAEQKWAPLWSETDYYRDCPSIYLRFLDALRVELETKIENPLNQINNYISQEGFPVPLKDFLQSTIHDIKELAKIVNSKLLSKYQPNPNPVSSVSNFAIPIGEQRWMELLSSHTTNTMLPYFLSLEDLVNRSDLDSVQGNIASLLNSIRGAFPQFLININYDINDYEDRIPIDPRQVPIGKLEEWSAIPTEAGSVVSYNGKIVICKQSHSGDRPTLLSPPDGNDPSWQRLFEDKNLVSGPSKIFSELIDSIDHALSLPSNDSSFDLDRVRKEITLVKDLLTTRMPITELLKAHVSPKSFQGLFRNITGILSLEDAPDLIARIIPDFNESAESYRKDMFSHIQKIKSFIHDFQDIVNGDSYVAPIWRGLTPQSAMKELWIFLRSIKNGEVTTLGNKVPATYVHNLSVGQVYFHALKLLKRAYAIQSTFANGDPHFCMRDFEEVLTIIRSMLLSQTINASGDITDKFPCDFNDRFYVPDYRTNYPLMRLIKEVLLAGERWASTRGYQDIRTVWRKDRRDALFDNLVRIEKEEEDLNNPNVRNTLLFDLREAWQELRNISHSGFDVIRKELASGTDRIHISGERMEILKEAYDRNKFKMMHIYRDVDNVLASEIPRFFARHWAPGIIVKTGDLFLFRGTIHRSKYSGVTNFSQAPLESGAFIYWEKPIWNPSVEYSPNAIVIRQEGSEEFIYRCIKTHKGIEPLISSSIPSPKRDSFDQNLVWESLTLQNDSRIVPGDFVFSLEQSNENSREEHRTSISIHEYSNNFEQKDFGTNIRRIKDGHLSSAKLLHAGAIGKWTNRTSFSARQNIILRHGISDMDIAFSKERGFWTDLTTFFPPVNFKSDIPLSFYDRLFMPPQILYWEYKAYPSYPGPSQKWLRQNATDGTSNYLIGGHTIGESISSNIFDFNFSHDVSGHAKFGASVLQLLEMFFFSSSYSHLIGNWGRCKMSPASACSFGYVESTKYADINYAYVKTVPTSLFETLIEFEPFNYYKIERDFRSKHNTIRWRGRFREAIEANSEKGMVLLKEILQGCDDNQLFLERYKDNVQAECERFMWNAFLRIGHLVSKFLSLSLEQSHEGDFVTPEEIRLMARLFSLMVAIIISIFSGDDRLQSAVFYEDGVLKFDDSILDTVFISENDAELIIQRAVNMALDFLNREENKKPLSDESFSMNVASDLQFLKVSSLPKISEQFQEERFFYLNEQRI